MALNTISSNRLSTNVKNTNFTAAEKQDLTDDIKPLLGSSGGGNKNLIINGAMQVAQRGTVTGITTPKYGGPDRFETHINGLGTWTTSQTSSASDQNTTGVYNSLKMQCTTANASPSATHYAILLHHIEGYNATQLQWGAANAKQVTLSFWCKANVSGWSSGTKSFVAEIQGGTTTYESGILVTLNANDTWQKISITFPAQTVQALNTTNASGLSINLWLDAGSTWTSGTLSSSWSDKANGDRAAGCNLGLGNNTANYFQITGVQLEVGSVATEFDHESFDEVARKCYRYYQPYIAYAEYVAGGTGNLGMPYVSFITPMRASPTITSDHESKSSNWSFSSMQFQGNANTGYYAYAISFNTSNSNYGYMRKYGYADSEL